MSKILTDWQRERFDEFERAIHKRIMCFRDGRYRGVGKTYLLNELGFTLQALGYKVLVYTPNKKMEYFAENFIYSSDNLRGIDNLKTVILFDEVEVFSDEAQELIKLFKQLRIPIVGFVRYKDEEKPIQQFKMEYKCEWI